MARSLRRRAGQMLLATVAVPVAAWGIEEAARRAEARDPRSTTTRRLRQVADVAKGLSRGPVADMLQRRQRTSVTWGEPEERRVDERPG